MNKNMPKTIDKDKNLPDVKKKQELDTPGAELPHTIEGTRYSTGRNNTAPDSMLSQKWANENAINLEIREKEQTKDHILAIVRATNPSNGQYLEDIVYHDFDTVKLKKTLDFIDAAIKNSRTKTGKTPFIENLKEPLLYGENGEIIPNLTPRGHIKMAKEMINFWNFGLRDAVTKASRRAYLKILNFEWKDKEEINEEYLERESVQRMIDERKNPDKTKEHIEDNSEKKKTETKKDNENKEENKEQINTGSGLPQEEHEKVLSKRKKEIKDNKKNIKNEKKKTSKRKGTQGTERIKTEKIEHAEKVNESTKELPDEDLKIDILLNTLRDKLTEDNKEISALNMLRITNYEYSEGNITEEQQNRVKKMIKEGKYNI